MNAIVYDGWIILCVCVCIYMIYTYTYILYTHVHIYIYIYLYILHYYCFVNHACAQCVQSIFPLSLSHLNAVPGKNDIK